jgi:hypothetical protein
MKQSLLFSLRVIALAILGAVTFPASAQTTAHGFYYPPPAWDQKLQCDTHATCPRFIVLSNWNNEAVLDRETGLVWERSPAENDFQNGTWADAQIRCNILLTLGNRRGWRLPTVQELASLVDPTVPIPGPTLPAGHPFSNVQSSVYWSATTVTDSTGSAWFVNFNDGSVFGGDRSLPHFAWCVRGGQGPDLQ